MASRLSHLHNAEQIPYLEILKSIAGVYVCQILTNRPLVRKTNVNCTDLWRRIVCMGVKLGTELHLV